MCLEDNCMFLKVCLGVNIFAPLISTRSGAKMCGKGSTEDKHLIYLITAHAIMPHDT